MDLFTPDVVNENILAQRVKVCQQFFQYFLTFFNLFCLIPRHPRTRCGLFLSNDNKNFSKLWANFQIIDKIFDKNFWLY